MSFQIYMFSSCPSRLAVFVQFVNSNIDLSVVWQCLHFGKSLLVKKTFPYR